MALESAHETRKHPRKEANEDFCSVNYFSESDVSLFLVCDGVSGKEGEIGSHLAANFLRDGIRKSIRKTLSEDKTKPKSIKQIIEEEFKRTSDRMLNETKAATTLELALFDHETQILHTAHSGDSEMYLIKGNAEDSPFLGARIEPFTTPHVDRQTGGPETRLGPGGYNRFDYQELDIGTMEDDHVFLFMTTDWIRERNLRDFTLKRGFDKYKRGDDLHSILSVIIDFYEQPRELLLDKIKNWMTRDKFDYVLDELRKLGFTPDLEKLNITDDNTRSDEKLNNILYEQRMKVFSQILSSTSSDNETGVKRLALIYDTAEGKIYDDFAAVVVDLKGSRKRYHEQKVITLEKQLRNGGSTFQRQRIEELRTEKDALQRENLRVAKANAELAEELADKSGYISPEEFERRKGVILRSEGEKSAGIIVENSDLTDRLRTASKELIEVRRTLTDYESQLRRLREAQETPPPVIVMGGLSNEQKEKLEKLHVIEEENRGYTRRVGELEALVEEQRTRAETSEKKAETIGQRLAEIRDKEAKQAGKVQVTTEVLDAAVTEAEERTRRETEKKVREETEGRVRKEYEQFVPEQILSEAVARREAEVRREYEGYVSKSVHDDELRIIREEAQKEAEQRIRQDYEGYVAPDIYQSTTAQLEAVQQGNSQLNAQLDSVRQEASGLRIQLDTEKEEEGRLRSRLNSAVEDTIRLRSHLTNSQAQLESAQRKYNGITDELSQKSTELSDAQTQLGYAQIEYNKLTEALSTKERELSDARAQLVLSQSNLYGLDARVEELTRNIEEHRRIITASDDEKVGMLSRYETQVSKYEAQLSQARGEIGKYKKLGEEQQRRAGEIEAALTKETEAKDALELQRDGLSRQVDSLSQQIDRFRGQIEEGVAQVANHRTQIADYEAKVAGYEKQAADLTSRLTEAEKRAEQFREEREKLDEEHSYYIPPELLPDWVNDKLASFDEYTEANFGDDVAPELQNERLEQRRKYVQELLNQCLSPTELDDELEGIEKTAQERLAEREQKVRAEYVDFISPIEYNIALEKVKEEVGKTADEKAELARKETEERVRKEYANHVSPDVHEAALTAREEAVRTDVEKRYANHVPPETLQAKETELEEARQASAQQKSQLELAQSNIRGLEERISAADCAFKTEKQRAETAEDALSAEKTARATAESTYQSQLAEKEKAREGLEQQLGAYESQNVGLAQANAGLTQRVDNAEASLITSQQTSEGYRVRAVEAEGKVNVYETEITEARQELARIRGQYDTLLESASAFEKRLNALEEISTELTKENAELTRTNEELMNEKGGLREDNGRLRDGNIVLIGDKERLADENKVLRREIAGYETDKEKLDRDSQEPVPEQLELNLAQPPVHEPVVEKVIGEEEKVGAKEVGTEKTGAEKAKTEEKKPETIDETIKNAIISNLRIMKVKFVSPSSVLYSNLFSTNGQSKQAEESSYIGQNNDDTSVTYEGSNDGNHTFEVLGRVYKSDKKGKVYSDKTELYRVKCSVRTSNGNYEIDRTSLDVRLGTNNGNSIMYNANALKDNGISGLPTNTPEANNCETSVSNNAQQNTQSIDGRLYTTTTSRKFVILGKKETKVDEDCGFFRVEYEMKVR